MGSSNSSNKQKNTFNNIISSKGGFRSISVGGLSFLKDQKMSRAEKPSRSSSSRTNQSPILTTKNDYRPPRSGAYNTKEETSLDHGKFYCDLLERTMVHVTTSIERIESSYKPRNSRSSLSSGNSVVGSIFDSTTGGPTYLYPNQLKIYSNIIAIAWFRMPTIVPVVMGWMKKTLEEVGSDLLNISLKVSNENATTTTTSPTAASTSPTTSTPPRSPTSSIPSSFATVTSPTPSKSEQKVTSSPRWTPIVEAFRSTQIKSLQRTHRNSGLLRYHFMYCNPSLFQWRWFYSEIKPELIRALTLEKW